MQLPRACAQNRDKLGLSSSGGSNESQNGLARQSLWRYSEKLKSSRISARRSAHCPGRVTFVSSFCGHIDTADGIEYDVPAHRHAVRWRVIRQEIRTWRLVWTSLIIVGRLARTMIWHQDEQTAHVAMQFPFAIYQEEPARQTLGRNFNPDNWNQHVIDQAWPVGPLQANPDVIIGLFQAEHYLEALAMTVCWGGMRGHAPIYRDREPHVIQDALQDCARSIQETNQAQHAWLILTGDQPPHLHWSAVLASKTLHFLCRAIAPEDQSPPVPRDGAVSLGYTWPGWIAQVPPDFRPPNWQGNTFEAYNRYMTAILVWAEQRHWTTTEIEATIFDERAA